MNSELLGAVQKALLEQWDPIGIIAAGGPSDEYDHYALALVELLLEGADALEVAYYLAESRSLHMWIGRLRITDKEHAVAETLEKLFLDLKTQ